MANLKYGVPSLKSIAYSNKYGPPPEHIRVAAEAMEYSELFPAFEGSREIRDKIITPNMVKMAVSQIPVSEEMKKMTKEVNEVLRDALRK